MQDRGARHPYRVTDAVAGLGREDMNSGALADHLQLVHRVRTLQVSRDQQRRMALVLQPLAELSGQRGLAGALQARQHDHRRRTLGEAQRPSLAAEDRDQLLVDDLDDLLRRVQRGMNLGAVSALLYCCDEVLDHAQVDVRLEQGEPDLARGRVDVGIGQPRLAAQIAERS